MLFRSYLKLCLFWISISFSWFPHCSLAVPELIAAFSPAPNILNIPFPNIVLSINSLHFRACYLKASFLLPDIIYHMCTIVVNFRGKFYISPLDIHVIRFAALAATVNFHLVFLLPFCLAHFQNLESLLALKTPRLRLSFRSSTFSCFLALSAATTGIS